MTRIAARNAALQLLYENMMGGVGGLETVSGLLELTPDDDAQSYLDDVLTGVRRESDALDERITRYLVDWTIDRLARVDLAILRLAVYELSFRNDIPTPVSINAAVDLAHTFSTPEAASFINGVLGSLVREEGLEKD